MRIEVLKELSSIDKIKRRDSYQYLKYLIRVAKELGY
jgi:hypothetical protein